MTTLEKRKELFHKSLHLNYEEPLEIISTKGTRIKCSDGYEYLDCFNNVFPLGHSRKILADIVSKQMMTSMLNTLYLHKSVVDYASALLETFPEPLKNGHVFFVNSGSEANDLAIRLAKSYRPDGKIVTLKRSYHGTTERTVGMSELYGQISKDIIVLDPETEYSEDISAVILETIQGCGGHTIPPMKEIFNKFKNSVCIADEVQVGFGRTGKMWAFEWQDCVPDIVTIGKPMGNGFPIGGVICSKKITQNFDLEYFNTYGGNPVACQVGLKVLKSIQEENLIERAQNIGNILKQELSSLENVEEFRGKGYFVGLILKPPLIAKNVCSRLKKEKKILVGYYDNVLRLKGPLTINDSEIKYLIDSIKEIIQ